MLKWQPKIIYSKKTEKIWHYEKNWPKEQTNICSFEWKSVHFSVDLAFEITLKQHTNFCNQSQTDTCRNNQWLSLDFDCRQTSAISTDKTFAV